MSTNQTTADDDLEFKIDTQRLAIQFAKNRKDQAREWETFQKLIAQRSPERVREMEFERGLSR